MEADGASGIAAVGHRVVHGGTRFTRADRDRRRGHRGHRGGERPRAAPQRRGARDDRRRATGDPDGPARRLFRHGLPRDAPGRGVPLSRPRGAGSTTWGVRRFGFHGLSVAWSTSAGGAALLGRDAARPLDRRRAPGERLLGHGRARRSIGRDVDGHDAARGPDDGDAVRLDRPGHRDAAAPRRAPLGRRARGQPRPCLGAPGRLRPDRRTCEPSSTPRPPATSERPSRSRCSCVAPRLPSRQRPRPCHASMRSSSRGASGRTARRSGTGSQAGSACSGWPVEPARGSVGVLAIEAREDLVIAAETVAATGHLRSDTA